MLTRTSLACNGTDYKVLRYRTGKTRKPLSSCKIDTTEDNSRTTRRCLWKHTAIAEQDGRRRKRNVTPQAIDPRRRRRNFRCPTCDLWPRDIACDVDHSSTQLRCIRSLSTHADLITSGPDVTIACSVWNIQLGDYWWNICSLKSDGSGRPGSDTTRYT